MSGSFTYSPSPSDLLDAFKLHYSAVPVKRLALYLGFCAVVGLAVSALSGATTAREMITFVCGMMAFGFGVFIVLHLVVRLWWMPRYTRRIFSQQADLRQQLDVRWDATNFTTQTANSVVNTHWPNFHLWNRNDRMMLLYRSEALFNFFPLDCEQRRAAADEIEVLLINAGVKRRP